jgi:predicted KAP-like P-loop ATPase
MQQLTMKFSPDLPISDMSEDLLKVKPFVDLIENAVINTETPFVFGVLGDWGVGKTSVLKLLQARCDQFSNQEHSVIPIWFNAWEYENESYIIYPLLHTIVKSYQANVVEKDKTKILGDAKDKFFQVVSTTLKAGAFMLGDLGLQSATNWLVGSPVKLEDVEKRVKEFYKATDTIIGETLSKWVNSVEELKKSFKELIDLYAEGLHRVHNMPIDSIRFLILVDDLDRCLPSTTISILENIKNHLAVPSVIFMLGLNPQVVYQGIKHKYSGSDINGREYLEKILNYTFYVPKPEIEDVAEFALKRIAALIPQEDHRIAYKHQLDTFSDVIKECHFNNPRKIKRILNRYLLFLGINTTTLSSFNIANIVRLIIIAEYFPEVFELYLRNPNKAQKELQILLQNTDKLDTFKSDFGIDISKSFATLIQMRSLLDNITQETEDGQVDLEKHVQAVFNITRLV